MTDLLTKDQIADTDATMNLFVFDENPYRGKR